jgi:DNA-binding transcriptional regulator YhcF (GntR family)
MAAFIYNQRVAQSESKLITHSPKNHMNGYHLSRRWFDWAFENPEMNTPVHTALFMWVVEKWNRLGQKEKFGLPTSEAMEASGIHSFNTYRKAFNHLVEWGFVVVIQASKNQYTSTIIALSKADNAPDNALDEALTKQHIMQSQSTGADMNRLIETVNQAVHLLPVQKKTGTAGTAVPMADADKKPAINTGLPQEALPETELIEDSVDFQRIWEIYDKKIGDRQRCEKKWHALSDREKRLAWRHIPKYVDSTPDKKYRANLETYLNQKRWNNEIMETYGKSGNKTTATTAAATAASAASTKPFLEKPRTSGGDPVRRNIFGKEEKSG